MNLHFLPFFRDIGETDMAFDGIVISNVVRDMKEKLIDGRIYKQDMERKTAPLKRADDAVLIDSSDMTIEQVTDTIVGLARERM